MICKQGLAMAGLLSSASSLCSRPMAPHVLSSPSSRSTCDLRILEVSMPCLPSVSSGKGPVHYMGGGPRTYPGGVTKWQWKRMQLKKTRQLEKARLMREKHLYEARKREELMAATPVLEMPWQRMSRVRPPNYVRADEHVTKLAARFQKRNAEDLWTEKDGPEKFEVIYDQSSPGRGTYNQDARSWKQSQTMECHEESRRPLISSQRHIPPISSDDVNKSSGGSYWSRPTSPLQMLSDLDDMSSQPHHQYTHSSPMDLKPSSHSYFRYAGKPRGSQVVYDNDGVSFEERQPSFSTGERHTRLSEARFFQKLDASCNNQWSRREGPLMESNASQRDMQPLPSDQDDNKFDGGSYLNRPTNSLQMLSDLDEMSSQHSSSMGHRPSSNSFPRYAGKTIVSVEERQSSLSTHGRQTGPSELSYFSKPDAYSSNEWPSREDPLMELNPYQNLSPYQHDKMRNSHGSSPGEMSPFNSSQNKGQESYLYDEYL